MKPMRIRPALLALSLLAGTAPAVAAPSGDPCEASRAAAGNRTAGVSDASPGSGPLRVFAVQFKQLASYAASYDTFATKMECLLRDYVEPHLDASKVNLVVLNEDIGLATIATGSRGAAARAIAAAAVPGNTPETYDASGVPSGAAAALGSVIAGYHRSYAAVQARFPGTDPRKAAILAATDTFVRGFMTTFSRLARRYGVWLVASNNQGDFDYSTELDDVAAFADPDLAGAYARGELRGVWVPREARAYNNAFLWGPQTLHAPQSGASADPDSPEYDPRTNLLYTNRKTPLTQIEQDFLALDEGDMSPQNTGPVEIPDARVAGFELGFAISLPAFEFGSGFGEPLSGDPCAGSLTWMRCLHARGVNTVIQPEANPGPWARYGADGGNFQSLTWGASTVRIVTDPTVPNFRYVVCPHMVGNLVDIPFDGQSAILERGRAGSGRAYVGAKDFLAGSDSDWAAPYAGLRPEFVALAPWVIGDDGSLAPPANRARLHERATAMMAGSGSVWENGYLETAIFADLEIP